MIGKKTLEGFASLASRNKTTLSLVVGVLIISIWALVRFYNLPTIYDMVTQQLIARSWLHGDFGPIQMGLTNYLLKVLFIYLPLEILPGSERLRLVLSTLTINAATFLLLCYAIGRLVKELAPNSKLYIHRAMLWLSLASSSVFWIQFSNSRNLEVVAGCFFIERCLHYMRSPTMHLSLGILVTSSLLFFADPLQIYMTALPTMVYLCTIYLKLAPKTIAKLSALLVAGVLGSKLLFYIVSKVLRITFVGGSNINTSWDIKLIFKATFLSLRAVLALLAGKSELGQLYQLLMMSITALVVYLFIISVIKKSLPQRLIVFVITFVACNLLVYIVSGQSLQPGTSRYLIMLAPIFMICLTLYDGKLLNLFKNTDLLTVVLSLSAAACLAGLLVIWHPSHDADKRLLAIKHYITTKNYTKVYASMDSALPLDFYFHTTETDIVALACGPNGLQLSLAKPASKPTTIDKELAIIFDGTKISNVPYICTADQVKVNFGTPLRTEFIDTNTVLIYSLESPSSVLSR